MLTFLQSGTPRGYIYNTAGSNILNVHAETAINFRDTAVSAERLEGVPWGIAGVSAVKTYPAKISLYPQRSSRSRTSRTAI